MNNLKEGTAMENNDKLEFIALNILTMMPLLKKKFFKPEPHCHLENLTHTHIHILLLLQYFGMMPISELGKKAKILKSNMTSLIDKLIEHELVERIADEHDRRIININLTKEGEVFLEEHKKIIVSQFKSKLVHLSQQDIDILYNSLKDFIQILNKLEE